MKRILATMLVASLTWCVTAVASAQTDEQAVKEKTVAKKVKAKGAGEKMMPEPEVQLKRLTKGLLLTAGQQKQIKPVLNDEYAKLKEIRQDENLSPKQIKVKVEALRTETIAKVRTMLTPEQAERYDLVNKEIKANKQQRMQAIRKEKLGTKSDPPVQEIKK